MRKESPQIHVLLEGSYKATYAAADQNRTALKWHQFWALCKKAVPPSPSRFAQPRGTSVVDLWALTQARRRGSRRLSVRAGFSAALVNGKYSPESRQGFKNHENYRSKACISARLSPAKC